MIHKCNRYLFSGGCYVIVWWMTIWQCKPNRGGFSLCCNAPVISVMATGCSLRIMKNMCQFILFLREIIGDPEKARKVMNENSEVWMRWVGVRKGGENIWGNILKKARERQSNRKEQWHENFKQVAGKTFSFMLLFHGWESPYWYIDFSIHLRLGPWQLDWEDEQDGSWWQGENLEARGESQNWKRNEHLGRPSGD